MIWWYQYDNEGKLITTFLDEKLRTQEENDYALQILSHPESYSQEQFMDKLHKFGTVSIILQIREGNDCRTGLLCIQTTQ